MFDFEKIPQEMKDETRKLTASVQRLRRAEKQFSLWKEELSIANGEYNSANQSYSAVSLRWDPETNLMTPLEELTEVKTK